MPSPSRAILFALLIGLPLAGCATSPGGSAGGDQTHDPYESVNRFFYKVNNAIDAVVLKPPALAYLNFVPAPARTGVHNVLQNLNSPVQLGNDVLQGSADRSGITAIRFLINSTVGVGGIFDVASGWGYPQQDTDFGVTLAIWGVGEGPYLFLPVIGPSNPRDALGFGVDATADPLNYIGKGNNVTTLRYTRFGIYAVDARANAQGALATVQKTALDPYATLRSLYRQNRASTIRATAVAEHYAQPSAGNPAAP